MATKAYHGGQFWEGLGDQFEDLRRQDQIIVADVLDAWFGPPPELLAELGSVLEQACRTSPPTHAEGMEQVISFKRGLPTGSVLAGSGSSSLMFSAWREWVPPGSRVALLEPSYGEYDHLTREVRGAEAHHYLLTAEDRFRFCPTQWLTWIHEVRPTVAVLVNPNNPTGTTFGIAELVPHLPRETLLWVDEAYIDYTHAETAEGLAANSDNVVVLKSLSKGYGLSGIRAAYLVGSPDRLASLRSHLPPWAVSFMAQFFGVKVWDYAAYYRARYRETEELRAEFVARLSTVPGEILADCANWVLFKLPPTVTAEAAVSRLIARGIYIRDAGKTAASLGDSVVRIAVRPREEQECLVQALSDVLQH